MTSRFLTGMLIVLLLTLGSSASGEKKPEAKRDNHLS